MDGEYVRVIRCRDCKHRPVKPEDYVDGFDLEFPDSICPCQCDGDQYYSWYPPDDWFCPRGEEKPEEEMEIDPDDPFEADIRKAIKNVQKVTADIQTVLLSPDSSKDPPEEPAIKIIDEDGVKGIFL